MIKSEALIRTLWLVDNYLLDKRIEANDLKAGIFTRIRSLNVLDDRTTMDAVQRVLKDSWSLTDNLDAMNMQLFEFHQGLPRLRSINSEFLYLIRLIDPDSLVCLHKDLNLPNNDKLDWHSIALRDGHYSNNVLNQGSVDTHIHLGGTLPPLFYWLTLMSGEVLINAVTDFVKSGYSCVPEKTWQTAMIEAMWLRLRLAYLVQQLTQNIGFPYLPNWSAESTVWQVFDSNSPPKAFADIRDKIAKFSHQQRRELPLKERRWPFWDPLHANGTKTEQSHYAQGERRLLTQLSKLLRSPSVQECSRLEIESYLLRYLRIKNAFHQLLIHDSGSDGLMRFMENFSRRGFFFGYTRHRKRQQRLYLQLERTRMRAALDMQLNHAYSGDMVVTAHHQPIRRLEMRVSILENNQFLRLIHAWLSAIAEHIHPLAPSNQHQPAYHDYWANYPFQASQIGLLFHLHKKPERLELGLSDLKLAEAARHSARKLGCVLHDFPELRKFIIGLDVAGDERSSPPRRYVSAYQHLSKLQKSHRSKCPETPIRLGWTYHVGEDYADLMTALRHIDEVDSLLLGQDGGRFGHALALAAVPSEFYHRRNNQTEVSLTTHLLDLVWAWGRITENRNQEEALWLEARVTALLENHRLGTSQTSNDFLTKCYQAMTLQSRINQSYSPFTPESSILKPPTTPYLESELLKFLPLFIENQTMISVQADSAWLTLCTSLQQQLRKHLAMRPVCIEANPTSNLIIGAFGQCRHLPYPILCNDGLAVSLNTDDPGLFMTSLPGEFSVMYQALKDTNTLAHREMLNWLKDRLADGQHSSFLDAHVPIGKDNPVLYRQTLNQLFKFTG